MNKNKIEARAGILAYGEDGDYEAYFVHLDFMDDTIGNIKEWDKFFDEVNDGRFENLVKITIEKT